MLSMHGGSRPDAGPASYRCCCCCGCWWWWWWTRWFRITGAERDWQINHLVGNSSHIHCIAVISRPPPLWSLSCTVFHQFSATYLKPIFVYIEKKEPLVAEVRTFYKGLALAFFFCLFCLFYRFIQYSFIRHVMSERRPHTAYNNQ